LLSTARHALTNRSHSLKGMGGNGKKKKKEKKKEKSSEGNNPGRET